MKLHTVSFGCQMNTADSNEMGRALGPYGFTAVENQEDADAILINTCTVREHAEHKAFSYVGSLREWKEADPNRLLIVAGCAAERTKKTLQRRFQHIDLVVGAKSIEQFPEIIKAALAEKFDWERDNNGFWPATPPPNPLPQGEREKNNLEISPFPSLQPTAYSRQPLSAFVTIMRGCNYSCTYCIVPYVRGREIYRPTKTILKEVQEAVRNGAKEIMLLGQTVNSYRVRNSGLGIEGGADGYLYFSDLLEAVARVDGAQRIRFMSPHPYYFTEKLIETLASTPQICEHIHLPLQSGSDRVLGLMARNYSRRRYMGIVKRLRDAVPGISVTTDIIVGFPTETEAEFRESLDAVKEAGFDHAYCFKFSARDGTPAANLKGEPPLSIKEERLERLLEAVDAMSRSKAEARVGQTLEVLWESPRQGRSRSNHIVLLNSGPAMEPGAVSRVGITDAKNRQLLGRLM